MVFLCRLNPAASLVLPPLTPDETNVSAEGIHSIRQSAGELTLEAIEEM